MDTIPVACTFGVAVTAALLGKGPEIILAFLVLWSPFVEHDFPRLLVLHQLGMKNTGADIEALGAPVLLISEINDYMGRGIIFHSACLPSSSNKIDAFSQEFSGNLNLQRINFAAPFSSKSLKFCEVRRKIHEHFMKI